MPAPANFSTIPEMFVRVSDHFAPHGRIVLGQTSRGEAVELSHKELRQRVDHFAAGLAALGVKRGDRVGMIAENRPEWVIADYAILSIGAADVPVFPSLTAEQVRWIFDNAGAEVLIVSNQFQLKKILSIADALPALRHVILMATGVSTVDERVQLFAEVTNRGKEFLQAHESFLETERAATKPEDLATIIYTSGTTGTPKGVMLTHDNLVSNLLASMKSLPVIDEHDVVLSYLPLCHSFERIASYFMFVSGVRTAFAESIDKVAENLRTVKPTIVTTVPRLLEKMYAKIQKKIDAQPSREQKIFKWAVNVGRDYHRQRRIGRISPIGRMQMATAQYLVFSKLHALIGGKLRFFIAGGAALPKELGEFFEAIGIVVLEGYGLTETSPVISVNHFETRTFGTVGPPIDGVKVKIAGDGEILARGPNIMTGYWRNEEATREAIDADGWFHTGDIGEIDAAGNIKITDRKKHLFVSSGGKNIAPQAIENELLQSPYIDQLFLIGDKRQYVSALIVPEFDNLYTFAKEHKITAPDTAALVANPAIVALFQSELDRLQKNLAKYELVRKFTLLANPFTIEAGELTPTQKLKRKVVEERYAEVIEKMYSS